MMTNGAGNHAQAQARARSFRAESLRRYPGERVNLFARAVAGAKLTAFRVQIILPPGLKFEKYQAKGLPGAMDPLFSYDEGSLFLIWDLEKKAGAQAVCDFEIVARVLPTLVDLHLECRAAAIAELDGEKLHSE